MFCISFALADVIHSKVSVSIISALDFQLLPYCPSWLLSKTWTDGFCPPRIFKTEELGEFYWDNDISFYKKGSKEEVTRQEERVSMIIPKGLAHVRHMTWLSNEKGKKKVEYQNRHFGHNGEHCCSYAWSHDKNELIFNEAYYKHHNLVLPTIYED